MNRTVSMTEQDHEPRCCCGHLYEICNAPNCGYGTPASADSAEEVLNGIRDALETRGYFHMANGRDIGLLLDEAARSGAVAWFRYGRWEGAWGGYVPPAGFFPSLLYWIGNCVGRRFGPPHERS